MRRHFLSINQPFDLFDYITPLQLIVCSLILGLIILFTIISIVKKNKTKQFKQSLIESENNVRIYTIGFDLKTAQYFDCYSPNKAKTIPFDEFLKKYSERDVQRLIIWLNELLKEKHTVPHHLEVSVLLKKKKMTSYAVLDVDYINYEKRILHLSSYLFPNIASKSHKKSKRTFIKKEEEIQKLFGSGRNKVVDRVTVYVVRLFSKYEFDSSSFRPDHLIVTKLVNHLASFLSPTRFLVILKTNEIALVDFKIKDRNSILTLGHHLSREADLYLNINALHDSYDFTIGVITEKKTKKSFKQLTKIARDMCIYIENEESNKNKVAIYNENINLNVSYQSKMVDEVGRVIKEKVLQATFTPLFNAITGTIIGQSSELTPLNSLLDNCRELQEYSLSYGLENELYELMSQKNLLIHRIKDSSVNNYLMICDYIFAYCDLLIEKTKKHKESLSLIQVTQFSDYEILAYQEEQGSAIDKLLTLKSQRISLSLLITSLDIELSNDILNMFDYFNIDGRLISGTTKNAQSVIFINNLIERLSSFHNVTVLCSNLESWTGIEIAIRAGINYISSHLISEDKVTIDQINKKRIAKLVSLAHK